MWAWRGRERQTTTLATLHLLQLVVYECGRGGEVKADYYSSNITCPAVNSEHCLTCHINVGYIFM